MIKNTSAQKSGTFNDAGSLPQNLIGLPITMRLSLGRNAGEKREPLNLASNPGAMIIPWNLARVKSWAYSIRANHFMSRA